MSLSPVQRVIAWVVPFLLFVGTWVFFVNAWPVAWVLLWLAPWWSVRQKLVGTAIPLEVGLALFGGLWVLGSRTGQAGPSAALGVVVVIAMIGLIGVALISAMRLARAGAPLSRT